MSILLEPLRSLLNMVTSLINGLIVGSLHFILNLLDGLDEVDGLLDHTVDSVSGFSLLLLIWAAAYSHLSPPNGLPSLKQP